MADLRCRVDRADIQRRRLIEDSCLCHGPLQRHTGTESLRVERADAICRPAVLQEIRYRTDQTAGTRRPQRTDQLPQYLDKGTQLTPAKKSSGVDYA